MAVADVYDALISPRIYKPALPHTEAVAIIRAGRGAQFDPGLVDVFEGLHERFAEIAIEYGDLVSAPAWTDDSKAARRPGVKNCPRCGGEMQIIAFINDGPDYEFDQRVAW